MSDRYGDSALTLNVRQLAEALGISKKSAYRLTRQADFPAFRVGKLILVSKERLAAWVDQHSDRPIE